VIEFPICNLDGDAVREGSAAIGVREGKYASVALSSHGHNPRLVIRSDHAAQGNASEKLVRLFVEQPVHLASPAFSNAMGPAAGVTDGPFAESRLTRIPRPAKEHAWT